MTQEAFIEKLDDKGYSYEIVGDKIVVTHKGHVHLSSLTSLPPDVEFKNGGYVFLNSLTSISPGVEFRNGKDVSFESLIDLYSGFKEWKGNIDGVEPKRLLNKMISIGLFNR